MISMLSSSRPTCWFIVTPMLVYSASLAPIASPNMSRPQERTVDRRCGLRQQDRVEVCISITAWPRCTRDVGAATQVNMCVFVCRNDVRSGTVVSQRTQRYGHDRLHTAEATDWPRARRE